MLKKVFPESQQKIANRSSSNIQSPVSPTAQGSSTGSTKGNFLKADRIFSESSNIVSAAATTSSSTNPSPLKSSVLQTNRLSSSSYNSPVKSDPQTGAGDIYGARATNLSKLKTISRSCSSTEFQSLKLGNYILKYFACSQFQSLYK